MSDTFRPDTLDRMFAAVERVRQRLLRSTAALAAAGIPYAVAGGNAVAVWVATRDDGAVRNTPDVDLLVNRADLERVVTAVTAVGFAYSILNGTHRFTDGHEGRGGIGIRMVFAGEKVRPDSVLPSPTLDESEAADGFRVVTLEALVRMKLVAFRMKDQMHLVDLSQQRLLDHTWPDRFPPPLADRLREILVDPDSRPSDEREGRFS